jgi:hypothetical protein
MRKVSHNTHCLYLPLFKEHESLSEKKRDVALLSSSRKYVIYKENA